MSTGHARFRLFCFCASVALAGCAAQASVTPIENSWVVFTATVTSTGETKEEPEQQRPVRFALPVPFFHQAPYNEWNDYYQETCEEMSIAMVDYYFEEKTFDAQKADAEMYQLTDFEERMGYGISLTIEELAGIVENYYGYRTRIIDDVSIETIEQEIFDGNPVIVPAAGKMLENPYFRGGGPWYHMLVITGYDESAFVTNDPGTAAGEGYRYEKNLLVDAIHDWTGKPEEIEKGIKRILVVYQDRSKH